MAEPPLTRTTRSPDTTVFTPVKPAGKVITISFGVATDDPAGILKLKKCPESEEGADSVNVLLTKLRLAACAVIV
jgi:hypothetical protein